MKCPTEETLLLAMVEGDSELESHLVDCPDCQRRCEAIGKITDGIRQEPGEFEDPELAGDLEAMIRRGADTPRPLRGGSRWRLFAALGAVAAAAVLFIKPLNTGSDGFQFRGSTLGNQTQWVSFSAFLAKGHQPVSQRIRADDALVFGYTNRPPSPFRYLMIFAQDAKGHVFWFYPEYSDAEQDPESISIRVGPEGYELSDQIQHQLQPGPLRLVALFSREPQRVKAVESWLASEQPGLERPTLRLPPDLGQVSKLIEVH